MLSAALRMPSVRTLPTIMICSGSTKPLRRPSKRRSTNRFRERALIDEKPADERNQDDVLRQLGAHHFLQTFPTYILDLFQFSNLEATNHHRSRNITFRDGGGAPRRTRTADLLFTKQLLYQLSYWGYATELLARASAHHKMKDVGSNPCSKSILEIFAA